MTIALNMIIGPYEEPFLNAAINSVVGLCDEFIIIDTAPGNNPNRELLDAHTNWCFPDGEFKIIDMPRGEDKDFSFAEARELARINTKSEWVLRLDADEVIHEKDIPTLLKAVEITDSAIEVWFYHFMIYPWLYQYTEAKKILFRTNDFYWYNGVHELPCIQGEIRTLPIYYYHYGYCRGQREVFKRWQLYKEIIGKSMWYDGLNPNEILTDRIPMCKNFTDSHPKVVQHTLDEMFGDASPFVVKEIPRYSMTDNYVGLLLITYNDVENLQKMLSSLEATVDYPTVLHVIDLGSTDGTYDFLLDWQQSMFLSRNMFLTDIVVEAWSKLESLTKTMNAGFKHLMSRQECEYIGWIHPDMTFESGWLSELVSILLYHPEVGKVCSWNTREGYAQSDELVPGHEQAYLIRRGILLKIGLFDERFIDIGGWEDIDMNRRILQEGYKVAKAPKSNVFHKGMATREKRDTTSEQLLNKSFYKKKWGDNKDGELFT